MKTSIYQKHLITLNTYGSVVFAGWLPSSPLASLHANDPVVRPGIKNFGNAVYSQVSQDELILNQKVKQKIRLE